MTDTDTEQRLRELRVADMAAQAARQRIDTGRAWRELSLMRSRRTTNRRRRLAIAVAITAGIAIVIPTLWSGGPSKVQPSTAPSGGAAPVRMYPDAIVARIPLGGVIRVVGDARQAWAIKGSGKLDAANYQLARIDLRTDRVTLRSDLGKQPASIALGGGALWLTTSFGQAQGQVARLNPVTGKVVATLHLPAGHCPGLAYAGGQLWAACEVSSAKALDFFRVDPATGAVTWRAGPAPNLFGDYEQIGSMAAAPGGIWYAYPRTGLRGLIDQSGQVRSVTVHDPAYPVSFTSTTELVYGEGAIWAFTNDESIARIDPATGRVTHFYTYRTYDPHYHDWIAALAVGNGSLWLSDGSRVLRVAMATGRPTGGVRSGPGVCARVLCLPLYSTPGAIWMPGPRQLIRIDPSRIPG